MVGFGYRFVKAVEKPLILLGDCHHGIVEVDSVIGASQWTLGTCLVDVVARLHILEHLFECELLPLFLKFLEPATGAGLG